MNTLVKIPRSLLLRALDDLERSHAFAGERLGFFSFRQSLDPEGTHLLCFEYHSIPDDQYTRDYKVGGRMNGAAIQAAMSRAYQNQAGQLWVHTHSRRGFPGASLTDRREGPRVAQSCANAQPKTLHGWAVISEDGITGEVRALDSIFHSLDDMTVVGWPMVVPQRSTKAGNRSVSARRPNIDGRYSRQGFLGPNSQQVIASARIGIVGLGGGGSHLVQQLAHIGFQNVVLCDAQRIEDTNLNRLVGATVDDVKHQTHKVEIAARLYRGLQPKAIIDDRSLGWEEKRSALRRCDLILGAIDGFAARRDLEAFCRSQMIPLIDIGMKVLRSKIGHPEIRGQVILSMPGEICMKCLQFITDANLAEEAQRYDDDPQPQVVWSNGVLASSAIGYALGLLTGWSGDSIPSCRVDYRGSQMVMSPSNIPKVLRDHTCSHFPLSRCGDAIYRSL